MGRGRIWRQAQGTEDRRCQRIIGDECTSVMMATCRPPSMHRCVLDRRGRRSSMMPPLYLSIDHSRGIDTSADGGGGGGVTT